MQDARLGRIRDWGGGEEESACGFDFQALANSLQRWRLGNELIIFDSVGTWSSARRLAGCFCCGRVGMAPPLSNSKHRFRVIPVQRQGNGNSLFCSCFFREIASVWYLF